MWDSCVYDGPIGKFDDPSLMTLSFAVEPSVAMVSLRLRHVWHMLPSDDTTPQSAKLFVEGQHERNRKLESDEPVPEDPGPPSLHTPWRDSIYYIWNNVFYDVMDFLLPAKSIVGHFHPPSHEVFGLNYQKPQDGTFDVVCKSWDTNVLLIPAYRDSKVIIRVTGEQSIDERTSEMDLGTFSDSNISEIWWVKKGMKVRFYVEGELATDCQGLAAAIVCGIVCTEHHETEHHDTENSETKNDETETGEIENQDTETREARNHGLKVISQSNKRTRRNPQSRIRCSKALWP